MSFTSSNDGVRTTVSGMYEKLKDAASKIASRRTLEGFGQEPSRFDVFDGT